jgi:hypothetical protein
LLLLLLLAQALRTAQRAADGATPSAEQQCRSRHKYAQSCVVEASPLLACLLPCVWRAHVPVRALCVQPITRAGWSRANSSESRLIEAACLCLCLRLCAQELLPALARSAEAALGAQAWAAVQPALVTGV